MYILLGGTVPFHGIGEDIFATVSKGKYSVRYFFRVSILQCFACLIGS